jgi:hypothetical protein
MAIAIGRATAHADGDTEVRATTELTREPDGPWLHLDSLLRTKLEPFDAHRDGKVTSIAIGPRLNVTLEGAWWFAGQRPLGDGRIADRDIPGRGWDAGMRVVYDLGPVQVGAGASIHVVDGPYGSGQHRDLSLSLTRQFRWPGRTPGWISLSIRHRQWQGVPPTGEANETLLMLGLGWAF